MHVITLSGFSFFDFRTAARFRNPDTGDKRIHIFQFRTVRRQDGRFVDITVCDGVIVPVYNHPVNELTVFGSPEVAVQGRIITAAFFRFIELDPAPLRSQNGIQKRVVPCGRSNIVFGMFVVKPFQRIRNFFIRKRCREFQNEINPVFRSVCVVIGIPSVVAIVDMQDHHVFVRVLMERVQYAAPPCAFGYTRV